MGFDGYPVTVMNQPDKLENSDPLILMVEDDESAAKLAAAHLARAGFRTHHLWEGESVLEEAKRLLPDAVLLDLYLPGMDGFEVCRLLKQTQETKHIPVIVLSAHRQREHVSKALASGADDFLIKPIDAHLLLHKLQTNLPEEESSVAEVEKPPDNKGSERRQFIRIRENAGGIFEGDFQVVDLSEGGAGLIGNAPVEEGSVIDLKCTRFGEIFGQTVLPVRVRYARPIRGKGVYRIGVEFVGLPEDKRKKIRQYIFKRQAAKVRTGQAESR